MPTIIVQDSDAAILDVLTNILEEAVYKVLGFDECSNKFFDLPRMLKPYLILLDYKLIGADCLHGLKQLKVLHNRLPVIAFTTYSAIVDRYARLGFNDCLLKPFDLEILYSTLNRNLQTTVINLT